MAFLLSRLIAVEPGPSPPPAAAAAAKSTAEAAAEAANMRGSEVLGALEVVGPHRASLLHLALPVELRRGRPGAAGGSRLPLSIVIALKDIPLPVGYHAPFITSRLSARAAGLLTLGLSPLRPPGPATSRTARRGRSTSGPE